MRISLTDNAYHRLHEMLLRKSPSLGAMPTWWSELQAKAKDTFVKKGIPNNKWEAYRYTKLGKLAQLFLHAKYIGSNAQESMPKVLPNHFASALPGYHVFFYNGKLHTLPLLPTGVRLSNLVQANREDTSKIAQWMTNEYCTTGDPLIALNTAFLDNVWLLSVAPGHCIDLPIYLHYYTHTDGDMPGMVYGNRLLHMASKSKVTIVECFYSSKKTPVLYTQVGGMKIEDDAQGEYYRLQIENDIHLLHYHLASLGEKSSLKQYTLSYNTPFVRNADRFDLKSAGSMVAVGGGYLGSDRSHIEQAQHLVHEGIATEAHVCYKGVVAKQSSGIFYSLADVKPHAQKTDTTQYHHGWIWDDSASIYARPQLQIETDDVMCRHGATMATPDASIYFYLQSRGLSKKEALKLLLNGFLAESIPSKMTCKDLIVYLKHLLTAFCSHFVQREEVQSH